MGKCKEYIYKNKMNKRIFSVNVTVLFIASLLLVAFAPITVATSEADKEEAEEYIEIFNEYYEIIKKDVEEAEAAYHTGNREIYKEKIDKVVKDVYDATGTLEFYDIHYTSMNYVRVEFHMARSEFFIARMHAEYEGPGAQYNYDPESSFENLKEGMEHLDKAKSLLPGSKLPGFGAILAIAGVLAVAYFLRRRK